MKLTYNIYTLLLLSSASIFLSCEDDDISPNETGSIKIEFDNHVGEEDLVLNTDYVNSSGETFRITRLNYYISNIKLTTSSGTEFIVPQDSSYFLIMEDHAESQIITINNVPAGDYNEISFTIGVDSLRSTMDVSKRPGVLDPAQGHDGMYWTWNSGYIFFKMEGTSPVAPADQENKFYYHIGGYGGFDSPTLNNIRETSVSLGSARAEVRSNKIPEVHLHADVQEFFKTPNQFKIADYSLVMFSDFSTKISENYVNMFKYDHVHN
jgi:hypothetical protein